MRIIYQMVIRREVGRRIQHFETATTISSSTGVEERPEVVMAGGHAAKARANLVANAGSREASIEESDWIACI